MLRYRSIGWCIDSLTASFTTIHCHLLIINARAIVLRGSYYEGTTNPHESLAVVTTPLL